MTDTARLQMLISESGLKKNYIAKVLGVTAETLSRKIRNKSNFNSCEIKKLSEVLGIDSFEDINEIFFAGE